MAGQVRLAYLEAMGIQAWGLRVAPQQARAELTDLASGTPSMESLGVDDTHARQEPAAEAGPVLQTESALPEPNKPPRADSPPSLDAASSCDWDGLQAEVKACTACPLHQTRTQTVFGVGDPAADWMVIGEAPGEQEDLQGEPFVGRAGLLLNEMLRAIGLSREQVFIANILKCRPPKNRDPQPAEAAACEGYLKRQIACVKPKIILAVGRIAAQNLLKTTTPIGKLRGRLHDYQGVPLVVTYHPAYLLRSPLEKRNAFDDLRLARQTYRKTPQP